MEQEVLLKNRKCCKKLSWRSSFKGNYDNYQKGGSQGTRR